MYVWSIQQQRNLFIWEKWSQSFYSRQLFCNLLLYVCLADQILFVLLTENTGQHKMDFYFLFWIFSALVSTCYTYVWDVRMDWGLMDPNHGFLRAKLLFKHLVSGSLLLIFRLSLNASLPQRHCVKTQLTATTWNEICFISHHTNNCSFMLTKLDRKRNPTNILIIGKSGTPSHKRCVGLFNLRIFFWKWTQCM